MSLTFYFEEFHNNSNTPKSTPPPKQEKVKRPKNAYFLYSAKMRKSKDVKRLNLHCSELSKKLGTMWNNETKDVHMKYQRLAEQEAIRHKLQHPHYRYSPQNKRRKCGEAEVSNSPVEKQKHNPDIISLEKNFLYNTLSDSTETYSEPQFEQVDTLYQTDSLSTATPPSSVLGEFHIHLDGSHLDSLSLSLARSIDFVVITDKKN